MTTLKGPVPWIIMGDFNCVLKYEGKRGGRLPSAVALTELQKAVDERELVEVGYSGGNFT